MLKIGALALNSALNISGYNQELKQTSRIVIGKSKFINFKDSAFKFGNSFRKLFWLKRGIKDELNELESKTAKGN